MMNKIFNLTSTFKSEEQEDGSIMVRGLASSVAKDRVGDIIDADAWTKGGLDNFQNNPVILFNHDKNKPIGRATKVTPTSDGLHMEAKISKHADIANLIKDGVLGAFSVGFRVKDAENMKETDGLRIKDAELFEVSVVSIPCNQAATFSLAKAFDSEMEYKDFKQTFQSVENSTSKEIDMSEETTTSGIDLEAFAKKVAEETAAKISMKQAEQKAAEEAEAKKVADAEAAKTLEGEKIQASIRSGIETGAEKLVTDIQADFDKQKEIDINAIKEKYESALKEKAEELEAMRNSKRDFSGRGNGDLSNLSQEAKQELLNARILGTITKKGWDTEYGKEVLEKAVGTSGIGNIVGGATSTTVTTALDIVTTTTFEEAVKLEQKVAPLFREVPVASGATILPFAPDAVAATFGTADTAENDANRLTGEGSSTGAYTATQILLTPHRLISHTSINNETEEKTLVNILPMLNQAMGRAHAKAIDARILFGHTSGSGIKGLIGKDGTDDGTTGTNGFAGISAAGFDLFKRTAGGGILGVKDDGTVVEDTIETAITAAEGGAGGAIEFVTPFGLLSLRKQMGKFGMNPADVTFILPIDGYYQLIDADGFTDISEVGPGLAGKLTGQVGTVFGSPVIVTDQMADVLRTAGSSGVSKTAALAVNSANYIIPRLRGVTFETDYQVQQQRNLIVAHQSLGFQELEAGSGSHLPAVRAVYN
ncbi:MAG: hypothetical protein CMK29_01960 [Porticoccaceae bacterium]|nr:hypothetical protein [Porticoccaceae bacterium]